MDIASGTGPPLGPTVLREILAKAGELAEPATVEAFEMITEGDPTSCCGSQRERRRIKLGTQACLHCPTNETQHDGFSRQEGNAT
jgi:hypothetical protein